MMFDEKTGNPAHDNVARILNRSIRRNVREKFRVHARGWKRRAYIRRVEGDRYAELVVALMKDRIAAATRTSGR